jgi:hypothetical protein
MALPIILGVGAAIAAAGGIGAGINGAVKMKDAADTMSMAKTSHDNNLKRFESANLSTSAVMDELGKKELETLYSFDEFTTVWSKIHNKPDFKTFDKDNIAITNYSPEELKNVSVGANVLLGGLGGAAVGTAGGFAAAGVATAAVTALGTASTGAAIASLSGIALTNATLAALGGGAIAAGGGGIALGTTILGVSTLGIGLLIGGAIFSISGNSISSKADEAYKQMLEAESVINEICDYLGNLKILARKYLITFIKASNRYSAWFANLRNTVEIEGHSDWNSFSEEEKLNAENTVLMVGLLYAMSKVKLVIASDSDNSKNAINYADAQAALTKAVALGVIEDIA